MKSVGLDLITLLHSKIISAINLKLNDLDQLQHPAVTTGNLIPFSFIHYRNSTIGEVYNTRNIDV